MSNEANQQLAELHERFLRINADKMQSIACAIAEIGRASERLDNYERNNAVKQMVSLSSEMITLSQLRPEIPMADSTHLFQ